MLQIDPFESFRKGVIHNVCHAKIDVFQNPTSSRTKLYETLKNFWGLSRLNQISPSERDILYEWSQNRFRQDGVRSVQKFYRTLHTALNEIYVQWQIKPEIQVQISADSLKPMPNCYIKRIRALTSFRYRTLICVNEVRRAILFELISKASGRRTTTRFSAINRHISRDYFYHCSYKIEALHVRLCSRENDLSSGICWNLLVSSHWVEKSVDRWR